MYGMKFSNDYEDVEKIVMKLSKKDLLHICNGSFKKSPYTKYILSLIINNESIGFIEVYNLPDEKYEFIVIAINPKYRGRGYSNILLNKLFEEYDNNIRMYSPDRAQRSMIAAGMEDTDKAFAACVKMGD